MAFKHPGKQIFEALVHRTVYAEVAKSAEYASNGRASIFLIF